MRLDGTLSDYPLSDLFQLVFLGNRSGTLRIFSSGDEGIIVFADSLLKCGKTKKFSGLKAVKEILNWKSGKFVFDTESIIKLADEDRIDLPIQQFILGISTELDECEDLMSRIGGDDRKLILISVLHKNEPVTITPIQWQIITHIGDAPSLSQLKGRVSISEPELLRAIIDLRDKRLLELA